MLLARVNLARTRRREGAHKRHGSGVLWFENGVLWFGERPIQISPRELSHHESHMFLSLPGSRSFVLGTCTAISRSHLQSSISIFRFES